MALRHNPELAIFLTLALGFFIGRLRIGTFSLGTVVGTLLAGAFTESTVIGTAGEAIHRLDLPGAEKIALVNNIPVAYAVTYLIGTAFIVWFLPVVGPRLMGVNLREEGRKLQDQISGGEEPEAGVQSAFQTFTARVYRVTNDRLVNRTVAELEAQPRDFRVLICRIRHHGTIVEAEPPTVIHKEDVVAVMTRTETLTARGTEIGPEVDDKVLLDFPQEFLDVVVTNKALAGKTLRELAALEMARGVFLRKLVRLGQPMPFTPETRIDRGDVLSLVGAKREVERAAKKVGYADRPTVATDMIFVGLGKIGR